MKFGKLENGRLIHFKNPIRTETKDIFTNDPVLLLQYGWKEIVYTEPEEREGFYPVSHWEETETKIIETWTYESIPDEPTAEDYEAALSELGVDAE